MPEDEGCEEEVGRIQRRTGDLRELIKYASDLSSLHPRGHPGGRVCNWGDEALANNRDRREKNVIALHVHLAQ